MMGVADLRNAFNSVAAPAFQCMRATLHYDRSSGAEAQVLTFSGRRQDGTAFEITSAPLAPNTDVNAAARATAQKLVDNPGLQS